MIVTLLAFCAALIWLTALWLAFLGTLKAHEHFERSPKIVPHPLEPVSILKPVKGLEPSLRGNLESFFKLDYHQYEILFSIAREDDPARPLIEELICAHPKIPARLLIGDAGVGPNPKVNNLIQSYQASRFDWIVISDSNVQVPRDYLLCTTAEFTPDVGVVTAVVAGTRSRTMGGLLESIYLNTFYARWMFIAREFGQDCVVGKSMLFRKSVAERFGGILQLGRFLAEDYMTGQAMRMLGLKVKMMRRPIEQPLSRYTFRDFWLRHIRWGRIRKSQAPLPIFFEPLTMMFPSGAMGAFALYIFAGLPTGLVFLAHVSLWFILDLSLMKSLGQKPRFMLLPGWLLRECLALPLWIQTICGNTVMWRGSRLKVKTGGLLEAQIENT